MRPIDVIRKQKHIVNTYRGEHEAAQRIVQTNPHDEVWKGNLARLEENLRAAAMDYAKMCIDFTEQFI